MKAAISTLSLILGNLVLSPHVLAQFIYPASSFFNPSANLYRGERQDPIEWFAANDFQIFGFLLSVNKFSSQLNKNENLTIFAPTDDAFATLAPETRARLSEPGKMEELLKYHVVTQGIGDRDIERGEVVTLAGTPVTIQGETLADRSTRIKLNDTIAQSSVKVNDNLVVVAIDEVLLPPNF
jgi:uncharacterized surface protein with fasciclin (FAS1) repeats